MYELDRGIICLIDVKQNKGRLAYKKNPGTKLIDVYKFKN